MVAHGTSDNAATYGVYAFGLLPAWTALRDSISLTVYYDAEIDIAGQPVIGLSQSGETPDVVRYVERARSRGAVTIAITNDETSPLAEVAELVLPHEAGPTLIASGSAAARIEGAAFRLPTPPAPSTLLAPLVSVVPGQLFARALAIAKGYDPDSPQHLSKVTRVL